MAHWCNLCRVYLKHHLVGAVICPEPLPEAADVSVPEITLAEDERQKALPKLKKKKKNKARDEGSGLRKKLKVSAAN